jgi:two-component system CheB/CheR fusion protein
LVIFGRHDLLQDAPISRVDLLLCRNTLMYFNADAQTRILARFCFSLNSGGLVVLGRAETMFSHTASFDPVDLKRRIFTVVSKANHRERLVLFAQSGREEVVRPDANHARLQNLAFDNAVDAQILLDGGACVLAVNSAARRNFGLGNGDIGVPLQDLELSYRPAELRAGLDRAQAERHDVVLKDVVWERDGSTRFLDIVLSPLYDDDRLLLGSRISFIDITPIKSLREELSHSKHELETAYEELQSTNEELETTNEELQSTVEELETTNEELQSTNEELETMNEELQSTNEELQTMNDELRSRSLELNSANSFMEAVFTSLRSAVVVVDRDMRVQVWNAGAVDLWGLRADETQKVYFFGLDIGLPVRDLHQPVRDVLTGSAGYRTEVLAATSRKGKPLQVRVTVSPLIADDRSVSGAILVMDDQASAG